MIIVGYSSNFKATISILELLHAYIITFSYLLLTSLKLILLILIISIQILINYF